MPVRTGGIGLDRYELIPDGIYEEINFKMVFLVKDRKIYRLLWNHVKQSGIISRRIYSTDKYIVTRNDSEIDPDIFTLENGFLFKKINTNKENVNARVKELYHINLKYLNRKFYNRSPSTDTRPLSGGPDDSLVVSPSVSSSVLPGVPPIDPTSNIKRNQEEYQSLIYALSEQQTLISKLQKESDVYRNAGLEIIEQFRGDHRLSAEEIGKLKGKLEQFQSKLQGREEELREQLKSYNEKLERANTENEQLHELIRIDTVMHRLQERSANERGQAEGRAQARARPGAQAPGSLKVHSRLIRPPQEDDRNEELSRRRSQLALLAGQNKSLVMENRVLNNRLTEVIKLLEAGNGGGGIDNDKMSQISEQLQGDHEASIERMRQENERNQEITKSQLEDCHRRLQGIESENRQQLQGLQEQYHQRYEAEISGINRNYRRLGEYEQRLEDERQQLDDEWRQLQQQYQQLQDQGRLYPVLASGGSYASDAHHGHPSHLPAAAPSDRMGAGHGPPVSLPLATVSRLGAAVPHGGSGVDKNAIRCPK